MDPFSAMFLSGAFGHRGPAHDKSARKAADKALTEVDELELRLNRTLLVMEAMWTLLRDNTELTDEDLAARMVELDSGDGRIDGHARREPLLCEECNRPTSQRIPRCVWCGHPVPIDPFG